jgi:hypothetical protein
MPDRDNGQAPPQRLSAAIDLSAAVIADWLSGHGGEIAVLGLVIHPRTPVTSESLARIAGSETAERRLQQGPRAVPEHRVPQRPWRRPHAVTAEHRAQPT